MGRATKLSVNRYSAGEIGVLVGGVGDHELLSIAVSLDCREPMFAALAAGPSASAPSAKDEKC
jgi:hypothetical protein